MALRQEMSGHNSTLHIQEQLAEESKQAPGSIPEITSKDFDIKWWNLDDGFSATISLATYHDEVVALKEYKINDKKSDLHQMAMQREKEVLTATFPSKYVVKPVAYCQKPPLILMEYMKNGALDFYMAMHMLTAKQKLTIANDIALGILTLLQKGIVHRDIKSGNVLITEDVHAKICDFDVSRRLDSEEPVTRLGTPEYVAPEYFYYRDLSEISLPAADVFNFGVLLIEMFVGHETFSKYAANFDINDKKKHLQSQLKKVSMLNQIINEHAKNWPPGLEGIIDDCLNLIPRRRSSMEDIQKRLNQLLLLTPDVPEEPVVIEKPVQKNTSIALFSIFSNTCWSPSRAGKTEQTEKTNVCSCTIL